MSDTHTETSLAPASIGARIRNNFELVQTRISAAPAAARAQWVGIPPKLRAALDRVAARVRDGLDIPSRGDLAELIARIEQVDAKLADLETRQRANGHSNGATTPANGEPAKAQPAKADEPKTPVKADEPKTATKADEPKTPAKADEPKTATKADEPKADIKVPAKADEPKAEAKSDGSAQANKPAKSRKKSKKKSAPN